jgi:hypothetical protein
LWLGRRGGVSGWSRRKRGRATVKKPEIRRPWVRSEIRRPKAERRPKLEVRRAATRGGDGLFLLWRTGAVQVLFSLHLLWGHKTCGHRHKTCGHGENFGRVLFWFMQGMLFAVPSPVNSLGVACV